MSKELMKDAIDIRNYIDGKGTFDKDVEAMDWIIEQAELTQHFTQKNGELNEFLQKYSGPKHLGRNVIDVAMDLIHEQAERAQELGGFMNKADESLVRNGKQIMKLTDEKAELEHQNKRYREFLQQAFKADDLEDIWNIEDEYRALEEKQSEKDTGI